MQDNSTEFQVWNLGTHTVIIADATHTAVLVEGFDYGTHVTQPAEGLLERGNVGSDPIDLVRSEMSSLKEQLEQRVS